MGPRITGAQFADARSTVIDVTIARTGGTDFTPTSGITGFVVRDGGCGRKQRVLGVLRLRKEIQSRGRHGGSHRRQHSEADAGHSGHAERTGQEPVQPERWQQRE